MNQQLLSPRQRLLLACYRTGQMSAAQMQEHIAHGEFPASFFAEEIADKPLLAVEEVRDNVVYLGRRQS